MCIDVIDGIDMTRENFFTGLLIYNYLGKNFLFTFDRIRCSTLPEKLALTPKSFIKK